MHACKICETIWKYLVTQNTLGSDCKHDTKNKGYDFSLLLFIGANLMRFTVTEISFDVILCYISQTFWGVY